MDQAKCKTYDGNIWFPSSLDMPKHARNIEEQVAFAKFICWKCPVRIPCLAWAQETREEFGIFGGYTPDERRVMRRDPPSRYWPTQTKINADKEAAIQSLRLAEGIGTLAAARQLSVSPTLLYRAWKKHGLGKRKTNTMSPPEFKEAS